MKLKYAFLMLLIGMISITGCSPEKEEQKVDDNAVVTVLPNKFNENTLQFRFVTTDKAIDFTKVEVIGQANRGDTWTHCGGGVFTNGNGQTYMYIAREAGFPGAIEAYDSFIDENYYYTVHWCSCTCTERSSSRTDSIEDVLAEQQVSETIGRISRHTRNKSVEDQSLERSESKVRFCGNPNFSNPFGSGVAEVTLGNGSIHYVWYHWENSIEGIQVNTQYFGTDPSGFGC